MRAGTFRRWEIRICDGCGRDSQPREHRDDPRPEVPCSTCGGREFTVRPLEFAAGSIRTVAMPAEVLAAS